MPIKHNKIVIFWIFFESFLYVSPFRANLFMVFVSLLIQYHSTGSHYVCTSDTGGFTPCWLCDCFSTKRLQTAIHWALHPYQLGNLGHYWMMSYRNFCTRHQTQNGNISRKCWWHSIERYRSLLQVSESVQKQSKTCGLKSDHCPWPS